MSYIKPEERATAILLLLYLANNANRRGELGISDKKLAHKFKCKRRDIRKAIALLVVEGGIAVIYTEYKHRRILKLLMTMAQREGVKRNYALTL